MSFKRMAWVQITLESIFWCVLKQNTKTVTVKKGLPQTKGSNSAAQHNAEATMFKFYLLVYSSKTKMNTISKKPQKNCSATNSFFLIGFISKHVAHIWPVALSDSPYPLLIRVYLTFIAKCTLVTSSCFSEVFITFVSYKLKILKYYLYYNCNQMSSKQQICDLAHRHQLICFHSISRVQLKYFKVLPEETQSSQEYDILIFFLCSAITIFVL